MTKDVLLSIRGLQFVAREEEDIEPVEMITAGDYYKKNGKHYIMYDEVMEGFDGNTRNIIKLTEDSLDITKKGVANVHMVFEKNKKNVSYYNTPFGSLLIGIDAKSVDIAETENNIDVNIKYNLEVNYEHLADCSIVLHIKSKESGDFSLVC
ncbi:MAG: DUF1934 domain-containing protein [Lachnospiraceae bacterium]|jgi:uncharacterized beta-barrel protein YwiB (DUF1934 family)|nr:DUF1934 domain-containing protein [Lachnospiraceae bacterium]